jgi:hypothetical protein
LARSYPASCKPVIRADRRRRAAVATDGRPRLPSQGLPILSHLQLPIRSGFSSIPPLTLGLEIPGNFEYHSWNRCRFPREAFFFGNNLLDTPKDILYDIEGYSDLVIDPQLMQCVGFLCKEEGSGFKKRKKPIATAFFVGIATELPEYSFSYLVTARHVIDPAEELWLRLAKHDGTVKHIPVPIEKWFKNPSSDIAVYPVDFSPKEFLYIAMPSQWLFPKSEHVPVHLGSEVIMLGLFTHFYGKKKHEVISRFGRIALLPEEPIRLDTSPKMEIKAYLIQSLSWGGESGSPAIIYNENSAHRSSFGIGVTWFSPRVLGLVHGHYPIREEVTPRHKYSGGVDLNAGIAIIVPSADILDTLHCPALVKEREKDWNNRPETLPIPDSQ